MQSEMAMFENAAKAALIQGSWNETRNCFLRSTPVGVNEIFGEAWNPLSDDAHCLQLQRDLHIERTYELFEGQECIRLTSRGSDDREHNYPLFVRKPIPNDADAGSIERLATVELAAIIGMANSREAFVIGLDRVGAEA